MEEDTGSEGGEGGGGTQRLLGALEFLTQEAEPSVTTLIDARNGFNKLSRLAMLWTVWHCGPVGGRFASIAIGIGRNFYSAIRGSHQLQT